MGWSKLQHVFDGHRDPRSGRWIARAHFQRNGAPVYLDSEEGRAWLEREQTRSFCFVSDRGTMTVRKERGRRGRMVLVRLPLVSRTHAQTVPRDDRCTHYRATRRHCRGVHRAAR